MPRTLHLEPHYSTEELKVHYRSSRDPVESCRWHLLWLVSEQMSLTEAAPVVGMHYDYARRIVVNYNRDGAEGLRNRRKNPRPYQDRRLLNDAQEAALAERLSTPPADGGLWSGPKETYYNSYYHQICCQPLKLSRQGKDMQQSLWQERLSLSDRARCYC